MLKIIIQHALISAVLASTAALIYNTIYSSGMDVNFSTLLNAKGIIGASVFGCVLMSIAYHVSYKWKGAKGIGISSILIAAISFASIVGVVGFKLPLEIENPELFPGLAIPMHFFPAMAFFCIAPFFKVEESV